MIHPFFINSNYLSEHVRRTLEGCGRHAESGWMVSDEMKGNLSDNHVKGTPFIVPEFPVQQLESTPRATRRVEVYCPKVHMLKQHISCMLKRGTLCDHAIAMLPSLQIAWHM